MPFGKMIKMKQFLGYLFIMAFPLMLKAQEEIGLYQGAIPGAKIPPPSYQETSVTGEDGVLRISKVSKPSLTVFQPAKPNGTAMIICPGGAYGILAFDKEGTKVARALSEIGITAFVLKYRLPSDLIMVDKSKGPLQDAMQAMFLVRKNAALWKVDPNKIGVMGFSAGGHLAASLSVHFDDLQIQNKENIRLRPDFSVLIYPVISFGTLGHAGSVKNLLGDQPSAAQRAYFSTQNHIRQQTPPAFLVHANDDATVPARNSTLYNENLSKVKVASEMHIYANGGHGFGLQNDKTKDQWFDRLKNWLSTNGWL